SIVVLFLIVAYAKTKIQNFYKNNATSRTSPNFHSLGRQVCVMWVSFLLVFYKDENQRLNVAL
ncbi:MAG: hypothetical protein LLF95_01950, partial [Bacteroidales bacterium]|nr:hypothetical protein [Bacteroidales bacterium]